MRKIIVIAPHSDDETIGAGGFLIKHKSIGDELFWINVTHASEEYGYTEEEEKYWDAVLLNVKNKIGFKELINLKLEPAGLDKIELNKIVGLLKKEIDRIAPEIVILPFKNDAHSDHRIVFEAALSCIKTFRCPSIEMILCMEIISETDYALCDYGFVPNYYVDISQYIDDKIDVLKLYESEMGISPFPRNEEAIRGLAKYRGASCYSDYAEAFRVVKIIDR